MIWRRTLLVALLGFTGLGLQTSVFGEMTLNGSKPELLLVIAVALAITEGPAVGAIAGFTFGLLADLVLGLPAGVTALTYTLVAHVVGRIRSQMQAPSAWMPIVLVALSTLVAVLFYGSVSFVLGEESLPVSRVLRHAIQSAIYNGLLTPFVYPVVRVLAARLRPRAAEVLGR